MILIVDFGSQYNQLIARRVRELRVYSQVVPPTIGLDHIERLAPDAIILSGGPSSIYEDDSPKVDPGIFSLGIPVLGICYGMQFMGHCLGGAVQGAGKREYGFARLELDRRNPLFKGLDQHTQCWMSHGDSLTALPPGFRITGSTANTRAAAISHADKKLYGLQFHPEVEHTPQGKKMIRSFLFDICRCRPAWTRSASTCRAMTAHRAPSIRSLASGTRRCRPSRASAVGTTRRPRRA